MDLFVMPSKRIKSYFDKRSSFLGMPCFCFKIDTLQLQYSENKNVKFIEGDNLFNYIREQKQIYSMDSKFSVLDSNNFKLRKKRLCEIRNFR